MEDEARDAIEKMFGKAGEAVPVVDVADLKKMREYGREVQARHPGEQFAIGMGVWQQMFGPEADIAAVSYRCSMLWIFERALQPFWTGGDLSEAAFKAAATMEMKRMEVGVVYKGGEMLEQFFVEVHKAAA
jgi:hypothetical protein